MVLYADDLLRRWVGWLGDRVHLLGYPHAAPFAAEGGRRTRRSAPIVDVLSCRVDAAVRRLVVEREREAAVLLSYYLAAGTVGDKAALVGIGRGSYYDDLDRAQRLILRYVAEAKRFQA